MKLIKNTIGNISEQIRTGKTPPTKIPEYFDGKILWFTPGDFSETLPLELSKRTLSDKAVKEKKAFIYEKGTVLITCIGEIGKVGLLKKEGSCNQQITGIKLKESIFPEFFAYWCKANKKLLEKKASNAVVPILNNSVLSKINIKYPESINDQIRIAHLLSKVEGLIAQRKQHLQQLDELLKSVFLEMFGDPVRNERGWNTLPFNEVGIFKSGGTPSKSRDDYWSGSFPWVSPKDMKVSKILDSEDHISESVFEETNLKRIAPNHLLIVVRGMILAHSFPLAINIIPIAINQDMKAIKPRKGIGVIYLQQCLNAAKHQILKLISTAGHGTKKFDSIAMQKLLIPIPPIELQDQLAAIVEKVEGIKARYQQSLAALENLYGVLSQRAFKGELDLSKVKTPNLPETDENINFQTEQQATEDLDNTFSELREELKSQSEPDHQGLAKHFNRYLETLHDNEFIIDDCMSFIQDQLTYPEPDSPPYHLTTFDYEKSLKPLIFDSLEDGRLQQAYCAERKCIILQKANGER